ncbi:MAG: hypothetical protein ACLQMT_10680 [Candidatus Acidiferrales bacterium]
MKMRGRLRGIAAVALAILFAGGSAWTQSTEEPVPAGPPSAQGSSPPVRPRPNGMWGPDDAFDFVGFEAGFAGKTVTGAPFTANVSTQMTQTLADGNRIERSTSGTIARDSQGRTRRDITLPAIGPWAASGQAAPHVVFINDPVAGTAYILDLDQKTAHAIGPRIWSGQRVTPGAGFAEKHPGSQNEVKTNLGTRTINGVKAQGTRIRRTIPAGAIGNVKPIRIVIERWYSPDLQMNVLVKRSDPRMGQTVFQLSDIQRKEPDASLFQVPADYTMTRGGPGGRGPFGRRRGRGQTPPAGENEPEQATPPPPPTPPQQAPQQ